MSRTLTNKFLMVIAVVGVIVACILTLEHFRPGAGGLCKAGPTGCEGVLHSRYGIVLGIPTAIVGLGMYLTFLYLGRERGKLLTKQSRLETERAQAYAEGEENATDTGLRPQIHKLDQFLWLMAASAFALSWWLQYTALFILGAFCPWCFTSALLVTLLFLLTSYDFHFAGQEATGEKKMLAGISTFIVVIMGFMYAPEVIGRYQVIKQGNILPKINAANVAADELVAKTRWWTGNPKAKVKMIEFADYMCPTCRITYMYLKQYVKQHPDAVRFGFLNFPVPIAAHKWSRQAAVAAEAAGKQGKFWEMHDYLFEHQDMMKEITFEPQDGFEKIAREVGLDMAKFRAEVAGSNAAQIVSNDFILGDKNQVTGTPTVFFINGKIVVPCVGPEEIQAVITNPNHPVWKGQ